MEFFFQGELKISLRFLNVFSTDILCLCWLPRSVNIKTHTHNGFIFVLYGRESCGLLHQENGG
jgi:hypothetical protein